MRSWIRRPLGAVIVAAAIVVSSASIYNMGSGGGGSPVVGGSLANLWIDDNGGTCTRNSTPAEYSDAAACSSFATAEDADSVGDLVMARCSTGTDCTIQSAGDTLDSSNSGFIKYQEEEGYAVTVGSWSRGTAADTFTIDGDKIIIDGFTVPHLDINSTALDVVARNIDGSSFDVAGDNVWMLDGDWSYEPCSPSNSDVQAQGPYFTNVTDSVVKGNWFHNNDSTGCTTASGALHLDCLQYRNMSSAWVEANKFGPHCGGGDDIIIGDGGGTTDVDNGMFSNNMFVQNQEDAGFDQAADVNFSGSDVSGKCGGTWYFRFNTIAPERKGYPAEDTACDGLSDNYGNIINQRISGGDGEVGNWTMFMSGTMSGSSNSSFLATPSSNPGGGCNFTNCGPSQSDLDAQFVNDDINGDTDETTDTHLIAGSDAINAFGGSASLCPDGDFDGHLRSGNCDIGADEYDSEANGDAPDWYISPSGSDSNTCTKAFPCLTIDRAYDMAGPGDVIALMNGTYANQTITGDFSKANFDEPVYVQPAPGATVEIGNSTASVSLQINGTDWLTIKDLTIDFWAIDDVGQMPDHLTLENIDSHVFTIAACTDCLISGGDVGPYETGTHAGQEDSQIGEGPSDPTSACQDAPNKGTTCTQDIIRLTLDGVFFHEIQDADVGDPHTDCLQFLEGEDVVLRNNVFGIQCGESNDLYIRGDYGPIDGFLIENNWFAGDGESGGGGDFAVRLSGQSEWPEASSSADDPPCRDVIIQNNTSLNRIAGDCDAIGGGVIVRGNYNLKMSSFHCTTNDPGGDGVWGVAAGWTYSDNVGGPSTNACVAQTGSLSTLAFVNETVGPNMDLHLANTNGSNDGENDLPSQYATTDIDGTSRPSGSGGDVGADER